MRAFTKKIHFLVGYSMVDYSKEFALVAFFMKHYKATIHVHVPLRSRAGHLNIPTIL